MSKTNKKPKLNEFKSEVLKNSIPKEFLGAFKIGHRVTSRQYIDEEMSWQLLFKVMRENCTESRKALEYITKFNNEYYRNVFGDDPIHKTAEQRRECTNRDNARRRDVTSVMSKRMVSLEPTMEDIVSFNDEDLFHRNVDEALTQIKSNSPKKK